MKINKVKISTCLVSLLVSVSLVPSVALANLVSISESTSGMSTITYHSSQDIIDYYNNNNIDLNAPTEWTTAPVVTAPYSSGSLSSSTLDNAVKLLNFYRYIAGINDNVTLDNEYTRLCQTGALVNAVNGQLDHKPSQPAGMATAMYQDGYNACSASNLSAGYWSLQYAVMGWMDDSDASNIDRLGHRRWAINPKMGKTGFGAVDNPRSYYGRWYSMYSFDESNTSASQRNVAWPAQNTPTVLFGNDQAWSLSTGDDLSSANVTVSVKRSTDGKVWNFAKNSRDFYVENKLYGQQGCVIFRPSGINIKDGASYDVTIDGIPHPVKYTVNFFTLPNAEIQGGNYEEIPWDNPGETSWIDFGNYDPQGGYTSSTTVASNVTPKKISNLKLKAISKGFKATWAKGSSARTTGYQIRYALSKSALKKAKAKVTISKRTVATKTVKKLKSNKRYYVQMRTYKTANGVKYYSAWSSTKSIVTK